MYNGTISSVTYLGISQLQFALVQTPDHVSSVKYTRLTHHPKARAKQLNCGSACKESNLSAQYHFVPTLFALVLV
jgi:hypothetical protein